jgi:hypothetical protein
MHMYCKLIRPLEEISMHGWLTHDRWNASGKLLLFLISPSPGVNYCSLPRFILCASIWFLPYSFVFCEIYASNWDNSYLMFSTLHLVIYPLSSSMVLQENLTGPFFLCSSVDHGSGNTTSICLLPFVSRIFSQCAKYIIMCLDFCDRVAEM